MSSEEDSSEFEEIEDDEMMFVLPALHVASTQEKRPCYTSALNGAQWIQEIIEGHENRCRTELRMEPRLFLAFSSMLRERNLLQNTRGVAVEEQFGIFMYMLSRNASYRALQERFQHSGIMANRAKWTAKHEKVLIDLLHEHSTPRYRSNNGWSTEGWSKVVKEFNQKFPEAKFSKVQIQEHESQLKRDYKILKQIRKKSGVAWDNKMGMVVTSDEVWDEIIEANTKARKFRNSSFPLFESMDQLYEGHIAEGKHNITSMRPNDGSSTMGNVGSSTMEGTSRHFDETERRDSDILFPNIDEPTRSECGDGLEQNQDVADISTQNVGLQSKKSTDNYQSSSSDKAKRSKNSIQETMDAYLQFRKEQAHMKEQKKENQFESFSISKCMNVLLAMDEISDEDKVQAPEVFKDAANQEIFLSFDPKLQSVWLKKELVKLHVWL